MYNWIKDSTAFYWCMEKDDGWTWWF